MALFENLSVGKLVAGNNSVTVDGSTGIITATTLAATGAISAAGVNNTGGVTGTYVGLTGDTIASGVIALIKDGTGKALLATGTAVPADGAALYAKGCLFIDTDVATGTTGLYCNKGTAAACVFTAVTQA